MPNELFPATGRRCRVMCMSGAALFGFMRGLDGRAAYRLYGMPADTKLVGISIVPDQPGVVAFLLESQEWEPLDDAGGTVPEVTFEILTALMPPGMRLEKPPALARGALRLLENDRRG